MNFSVCSPSQPLFLPSGQRLVLQSLNCELLPMQLFPPSQARTCLCLPPPHVALQALQLLQEPQEEGTAKERERDGYVVFCF